MKSFGKSYDKTCGLFINIFTGKQEAAKYSNSPHMRSTARS